MSAKKSDGKTVTVQQTGSPVRREPSQRQTLIGLGLNKMRRTRTLERLARHSDETERNPG
ncbi:MAG: hypothetical protein CVT81_16040 [Alphaproteobacteria bacterium HGW-Alphaproteobacteria-3]|nr:MAG: hypothetical protein CVT81_16040 [Alphaproteobacteria bacterium HGW-Alphaproteobacteria-3]